MFSKGGNILVPPDLGKMEKDWQQHFFAVRMVVGMAAQGSWDAEDPTTHLAPRPGTKGPWPDCCEMLLPILFYHPETEWKSNAAPKGTNRQRRVSLGYQPSLIHKHTTHSTHALTHETFLE